MAREDLVTETTKIKGSLLFPHINREAMGDPGTQALVAFLRMEADMADEKARRLRQQADAMAQQFGITEESQLAYGACCCCCWSLSECWHLFHLTIVLSFHLPNS